MTTAAIYCRQSLDRDDDRAAVTRQREDALALAASRGWSVIEEYVDNDTSASDKRKKRPGYEAMAAAYAAGRFDAIICADLDRLTRQPRQLEDWIDAAEERGLLLVTTNGEADLSTDAGRLFARVKAAVARSEVERKAARQRRAARQRAENGKAPKGVRLTGYATDGSVVENEAVIVREVFSRFAAGDSLLGVAKALNDAGHRTRRAGRWTPSTVRTMLLNPRYAGRAVYCGQANGVEGDWQPLVDGDTFDRVQAILSDPRRKTRQTTDRKHLGAGLYLCGECGKPIRSLSARSYRCKDGHVTRTRSHIDDYILDIIRARLSQPDVAELLAPANTDEARQITGEVKRQRERLAQVERDYDDDLIDARRYAVKREKIEAALADAESRRMALIGNPALGGVVAAPDPVAAFDQAGLMVQRAVVDAFLTVRLHRHPQGRKGFDPESVEVSWRVTSEDR